MLSPKSQNNAIFIPVACLSLFLCCALIFVFCRQSLPSKQNPVFSAIGTTIRCNLVQRQEYLIFVEYKNESHPRQFGVDTLIGTDAIAAKATFSQSDKQVPLQSFSKVLYFPGNGCTFRLVSAIWLDQDPGQQVIIQLQNLPNSLKDVRVLVVPWGQPVVKSSGIFMFVADSDLSPGHFINARDLKLVLITPMDLPRLNRFPIIGFTCPIGLKCRKSIRKGEALYPEYFELPIEPRSIRDLVQNGYSFKCWIVPDPVENTGNSR